MGDNCESAPETNKTDLKQRQKESAEGWFLSYALYFSKYPIPYDRDGRGTPRYKHIGLYAYRRTALEAFHALPPSPLELTERLEQLRFLEHGIRIRVVETDEPTIGVDTEDDVRAVEAWLAARPR